MANRFQHVMNTPEPTKDIQIDVSGIKVLKFSATWCGPCKALTEALTGVDIGVEIVEIDVDKNQNLAQQYNIRGVPTLILAQDGKEVKRIVGAASIDQLKEMVN